MKKILFPFQVGQSQYKEAFIVAVKFARNLNAELILLNAFDIVLDDNITKAYYYKQIKEKWILASNEVAIFTKYYLTKYAKTNDEIKVRFDHRFVYGDEIKEILNVVSSESIDMLVLPFSEVKSENKKSAHIINNDVFTSNSTSLLIIPPKFKFSPIKNIVFATDLKEHFFNELYFNEVLKYAKIFDARIHFLHVDTAGNEAKNHDNKVLKLINDVIGLNKKHIYQSVSSENITKGLINYVETNKMDLISVVKDEETLWSFLFEKSISKEVVETSKVPVLYMVEKTGII